MSKSDEIAGRLSVAASEVAEWRGLLDHPGWKKLQAALAEQVRLRQATICMTPLESFGKSLEQEFMKGEAAGLGLALAFPETQHELAKLDVSRLTVSLEMENQDETARNTPRRSRVDRDDFSGE